MIERADGVELFSVLHRDVGQGIVNVHYALVELPVEASPLLCLQRRREDRQAELRQLQPLGLHQLFLALWELFNVQRVFQLIRVSRKQLG